MAGSRPGIGECAFAVIDELPAVAPIVQGNLADAVRCGVQHLASRHFRSRWFQASAAGAHDEFAHAIGVIDNT